MTVSIELIPESGTVEQRVGLWDTFPVGTERRDEDSFTFCGCLNVSNQNCLYIDHSPETIYVDLKDDKTLYERNRTLYLSSLHRASGSPS